jgi:hypothetical protein
MPIRSSRQKAARERAMKAQLHPPPTPPPPVLDPDEIVSANGTQSLPENRPVPVRNKLGHYVKGTCGNPAGRPKNSLADLMRRISDKRRIPQFLGEVAAGIGKYRKVEIATRIKAAQLVLSYGYGRPDNYDGDGDYARYKNELRIEIKRVIGVRDEDV